VTAGLSLVFVLSLLAPARPDEAILREAKLAILDRDWDKAIEECDRLVLLFPQSSLIAQAHFYRARGLEGAGREERAVRAYDGFLRQFPGDGDLQQDARTAQLALARKLVDRGEDAYFRLMKEGLSDSARPVRRFAALQVSLLSDRRHAREAIPVLVEIVRKESSPDLRDRARIALLRLDTRALAEAEEDLARDGLPVVGRRAATAPHARARWITLRIYRSSSRGPDVDLKVPLALGELVYRALDEEPKRKLREEMGIDLENFWDALEKLRDKRILVIRTNRERIEITIE